MGENSRQARCVLLPVIVDGIDMTSQPGSPRTPARRSEIARNVKAPVAAGPPYPKRNTARKGPNAKKAPTTLLILIKDLKR